VGGGAGFNDGPGREGRRFPGAGVAFRGRASPPGGKRQMGCASRHRAVVGRGTGRWAGVMSPRTAMRIHSPTGATTATCLIYATAEGGRRGGRGDWLRTDRDNNSRSRCYRGDDPPRSDLNDALALRAKAILPSKAGPTSLYVGASGTTIAPIPGYQTSLRTPSRPLRPIHTEKKKITNVYATLAKLATVVVQPSPRVLSDA